MSTDSIIVGLEELISCIPDKSVIAVPAEYCGVPMAATRALVRRGIKGLHLFCVPWSGFQADLLIGAGAVQTLETSAVTLGEWGPAPRFVSAVQAGSITLKDSTCPAIHAALQAAEKGLPFMPIRGLLGTDILEHRDDWKVIDNPFADAKEPIVAVPALKPDFALFHAPLADRAGNIWVGLRREIVTLAHAAKSCLVTVEEIQDGDLLSDDRTAAGTIPALYVNGIAKVFRGAWPIGFLGYYAADEEHIRSYMELAASEGGFRRYLSEYVMSQQTTA